MRAGFARRLRDEIPAPPFLEGMTDLERTHRLIRRFARSAIAVVVLVGFGASCVLPQGQAGPYAQGPYGSSSHTMRVVYQPPTNKPEREEIRTFLQTNGSFENVTRGLSGMFELPQDIHVVWTECGAATASWDGRGNLVMCYEMAEFLKALFSRKITDRKQLRFAVMSSLMVVFLHELGHGLLSIYKLPSVGREEDAADQLASLLLIATGEIGLEVAIHGAQVFRVLALSGTKTPFFAEHSLDAQRYANLLCLVYGSNPDRLGSMVGNDKLPASRVRRCPTEYSKVSSAWTSLLHPYMRSSGQPSSPGYANDDDGSANYPRNNTSNNPRGYGNTGSSNSGYQGNSVGSSSGQWLCRAVGSYVPSSSDGSGPDYADPQNVDASKVGRTRDEAGVAALDSCSGMLAISTNIAIYPGALITQHCKVISCSQ